MRGGVSYSLTPGMDFPRSPACVSTVPRPTRRARPPSALCSRVCRRRPSSRSWRNAQSSRRTGTSMRQPSRSGSVTLATDSSARGARATRRKVTPTASSKACAPSRRRAKASGTARVARRRRYWCRKTRRPRPFAARLGGLLQRRQEGLVTRSGVPQDPRLVARIVNGTLLFFDLARSVFGHHPRQRERLQPGAHVTVVVNAKLLITLASALDGEVIDAVRVGVGTSDTERAARVVGWIRHRKDNV